MKKSDFSLQISEVKTTFSSRFILYSDFYILPCIQKGRLKILDFKRVGKSYFCILVSALKQSRPSDQILFLNHNRIFRGA